MNRKTVISYADWLVEVFNHWCVVLAVCGGGLYVRRYQCGAGFNNPSVYCADLEFITHIGREITRPLPA